MTRLKKSMRFTIIRGSGCYETYSFGGKKMNRIKNYISSLNFGDLQGHSSLAIIPIFGEETKSDYLTLDEALERELEVTETGSVPTLKFENKTGKEILIMRGEYVIGGKQNRMTAREIFLARDFCGEVPVNCVQQGRWGYQSDEPNEKFTSSEMKTPTTLGMASYRSQGEVWKEVNSLMQHTNTPSNSSDLNEIYHKREKDINDIANKFVLPEGAIGLVAVTQKEGGKTYSVEIFDKYETLKKNFQKMVKSYSLQALSGEEIEQTKDETLEFLRKLEFSEEEQKAVSLGTDLSLRGESSNGTALIYEDTLLYMGFGATSH
jgi:hypothetical protein